MDSFKSLRQVQKLHIEYCSIEPNNGLTIFIYPGEGFSERAACISTFIEFCAVKNLQATHKCRQLHKPRSNLPNSSAEDNSMLRSLLVR